MEGKTKWIKVTIVNDDNVTINTFVGTSEKVIEELESAIAATKEQWAAEDAEPEAETQGDATEETPADAEKTKESKTKRPFPWA